MTVVMSGVAITAGSIRSCLAAMGKRPPRVLTEIEVIPRL
jgi:hypothetical protein